MGTIRVTNLGKAYKQYPNRWSRLAEWLVPFSKPRHHLHWVLQDINFTVQPGEAVGIIGINGAGKSTLLKMITGTTQPTTGSVEITGRVAALLELGMGFHPEFTGRQNVIMSGQLLGLSVEEIAGLMPEIEAFAEIGDYIDQPVRVYSSGMQVRLAFSVATAVRPDVLIVDEALSVGDKYFSQKAFTRIHDFLTAGTTLLFVSHDAVAIKALCDKAILLHQGKTWLISDPERVIDLYNGIILEKSNQLSQITVQTTSQNAPVTKSLQTVEGFKPSHLQIDAGIIQLLDFKIINDTGKQIVAVTTGDRIRIRITVKSLVDKDNVYFGFALRDRLGITIYNTTSSALGHKGIALTTGVPVEVEFGLRVPLQPGHYSICFGVVSGDIGGGNFSEYLLHTINAEIIEILSSSTENRFGGLVDLSSIFTKISDEY